jgi:hypothetical protein
LLQRLRFECRLRERRPAGFLAVAAGVGSASSPVAASSPIAAIAAAVYYEVLQRGRFRRSGEVHQWMYDRQSLRDLLTTAGFTRFRLVAAGESGIPGWDDDCLDTQSDGTPAKPDSLYAEAIRP